VQSAQQSTQPRDALIRPRSGVDDLALHIGQNLAALLIEARPHDAGRSFKAGLFQMAQQRVDRGRPRARFSNDDTAPPYHCGSAAARQRRFLGLIGHEDRLTAVCPRALTLKRGKQLFLRKQCFDTSHQEQHRFLINLTIEVSMHDSMA
jgi:hypothetical protein